jgi:hypothetical protein
MLKKNLNSLNKKQAKRIEESEAIGIIEKSVSGAYTLQIDSILFHSKHDPIKEAQRLVNTLKTDDEKLLIFFGAGLGYSILHALQSKNCKVIWMEPYIGILKTAFSLHDFSTYIQTGRLVLSLPPFTEDELYSIFKGTSSMTANFISHRASLSWRNKEYLELKFLCESFFKKKDVNIATLSRFEKIWTKNLLLNFRFLPFMVPVSTLFGVAKGLPILVCAAGPGLYNAIDDIKKHRDCFILIAVDTALHILTGFNIDPDLIYSVDPQMINSSYLQGYKGKGKIVFDPTSTYHTLRLSEKWRAGFFSSTSSPLIRLLSGSIAIDIGDIPFGGSVSINSVSLAELMGASVVCMVGQDLAFTDGYAHCKGAILEERLNFKESRYFRRELHNYKQINYLPKIYIKSVDGKTHITNEKMQIFRKWFEDRAGEKNWTNLSISGGEIKGIPIKTFHECFSSIDPEEISVAKQKIHSLIENQSTQFVDINNFKETIQKNISELKQFEETLEQGLSKSRLIYTIIQKEPNNHSKLNRVIQEMEQIDEIVSSKKGLNSIIAIGIQRIVFTITEEYETNLQIEEKLDSKLSIAKKSILLYEGLYESARSIRISLKKLVFFQENMEE